MKVYSRRLVEQPLSSAFDLPMFSIGEEYTAEFASKWLSEGSLLRAKFLVSVTLFNEDGDYRFDGGCTSSMVLWIHLLSNSP